MKDQYAGDVGDFSKFGLLRNLQSEFPTEKIGIVWYLTPDETGGRALKDGGFIRYLGLEQCDPELYDKLQKIPGGTRRVSEFRRSGLLDHIFDYGDVLDTSTVKPKARRQAREEWFRGALEAMADCSQVFLDPDNGIASSRVTLTQVESDKFALPGELREFRSRGKTVICYQHATRVPFDQLLREKTAQFPGAFAIRWHRIQTRAYIVWPSEGNQRRLEEWARKLVNNNLWKSHFTLGPSSTSW